MIKKFLFLLLVFLPITSFSQTASFQSYITGFTNPVDVTHCGDKRLFVVERAGKIKIVKNGVVLSTPFLDIVDQVNDGGGEQGLLGLAFHPSYSTNGFFYVYYCSGTSTGETKVSRFTVSGNPDIANLSSQVIMWSLDQPYYNHNGGDIEFGLDGFLYFAPGDGGDGGDPGNRAQNMTLDFGKIIRINPQPNGTYTIPSSNPYANSTNVTTRRIWASGLRDPWRFGFDRETGDMWIGDVGQNAWEEIDFITSGDNSGPNFGWRCYEGLVPYNTSSGCQGSYDQPVIVQSHTNGWCAIIGGKVYRGIDYPTLQGLIMILKLGANL
jgi:glucose/arabinose dehydrogenase